MRPTLRLAAAAAPATAAVLLALPALAAAAPPPPVPSGASPLAPERQALRDYVTSGAYVQDVAAAVAPAKAALGARVDEIARQRTACEVAGARATVRTAIPTSTRGTVYLTVRRDLIPGLRVTARNASASARVAVLPVDTAAVSSSAASVTTFGSLTFARGNRRVTLRSVRVDLRRTTATVSVSVGGRRLTLARTPSTSRRKPTLSSAGRAEVIAARLQLTTAGRSALRPLRPRSSRFGLLTVQVEPAQSSPPTTAAPGTSGGSTTTPPATRTTPATTPTVAAPTPVAPTPSFVPDAATCAQVPTKPVIVLDIDETALSAYVGTTGGDPGGGAAGQLPELVGQAKALAPVKDLYDYAVGRGVGVDFITGRVPQQQTPTETNLDSEGYTQRIGITFRQSTSDDSATYKRDARAKLQQQGYTILLNVGDQCSDLFGGNAERAFKLPNTFYFTSDAPGSIDPRCDKLGAGGEVPTT